MRSRPGVALSIRRAAMEVTGPRNAFDVAIVGAGPAGSTLAALLAKRGASVALIDRDSFPRDKVCGEFLSYDALP
ncbi:MAG TPA: FAD-dependent oxidoreductase, partial [Thermoanaerobaculia bacterium]|nr:FAD-dependent oxidoreductase [Thermoanaerobaculia bacterium]